MLAFLSEATLISAALLAPSGILGDKNRFGLLCDRQFGCGDRLRLLFSRRLLGGSLARSGLGCSRGAGHGRCALLGRGYNLFLLLALLGVAVSRLPLPSGEHAPLESWTKYL